MKITLLLKHDGTRRPCREPFEGADHALAEGSCPYCGEGGCTFCGAKDCDARGGAYRCDPSKGKRFTGAFKVAGKGRRPSADDRAWEADAGCLACRAHLGTLRVEANTLFGVREDERALRSGVRIY